MSCGEESTQFIKSFKFLNFLSKHEKFKDVVRQNWVADFVGDPLLMLKQKLKKVKIVLSKYIKDKYSYLFKQLAIREHIVRVKEILFEEEPKIENKIMLQKAS